MKKIHLLPTLFLSLATSFMTGCSDWTDVEAEVFPEDITSEEYYEALREYKRSDHQLAFGWFGGWSLYEEITCRNPGQCRHRVYLG